MFSLFSNNQFTIKNKSDNKNSNIIIIVMLWPHDHIT